MSRSQSLVVQRTNEHIRLAREIGRGGEGAVFEVERDPAHVAKIYHAAPDHRKQQKLQFMAAKASSSLLKVAAWPKDILCDETNRLRGILMPRINARRDIHELYSPKSRAEAFPEADLPFLLHVACNLARAITVLHDHSIVIGDINQGNVLAGHDGTVILIDCDSFQVRTPNGVMPCDVGVPLFTAPELQGRHFRGMVRDCSHDCFGLAVLIFHLLFMGRHPFAGRYRGRGEMPIENAISESRFAYSKRRQNTGMDAPPGTISLESFGPVVADLFERAFEKGQPRPDSRQWLSALTGVQSQLQVCAVVSWHHFAKPAPSCPWCPIEHELGVRLFGMRGTATAQLKEGGASEIWRLVEQELSPGPDPPLPHEQVRPSEPAEQPESILKLVRKIASIAVTVIGVGTCELVKEPEGSLAAIIMYVIAAAIWPWPKWFKIAAANDQLRKAQREWEAALSTWRLQASRERFIAQVSELRQLKGQIDELRPTKQRALEAAQRARKETQLERYLDRFRIDRASIPKIGPTRTAMLASYGIETAADITVSKVYRLPGFGATLTESLLAWRDSHERNFRFNPIEPLDPQAAQRIHVDYAQKEASLLAKMRSGVTELSRTRQSIEQARKRLMPSLEKAWTTLVEAEARIDALR